MHVLFTLMIVTVTASVPYWLPILLKQLSDLKLYPSYNRLPTIAAILFVGSFYLPNIHISTETVTFQQHFIGGGVYATCLFIYLQKLIGWRSRWLIELMASFAWVSSLGVANELLEFTLVKLQVTNIRLTDTSWDLVANTSGALLAYGIYLFVRRITKG